MKSLVLVRILKRFSKALTCRIQRLVVPFMIVKNNKNTQGFRRDFVV